MSHNGHNGLDLRSATGGEINDAMRRGVLDALREHKNAGREIVVWEDGRVVHVPPEEIDADPGAVPEESPEAPARAPR